MSIATPGSGWNGFDSEKALHGSTSPSLPTNLNDAESTCSTHGDRSVDSRSRLWAAMASWGIEARGIQPAPVSERSSRDFNKVFSLWFSMSVGLIPIITGMAGTLSYGLSLTAASLIVLFFCILCTIPVAYLSTLAPKTGLRQMIQARYTFGLYGSIIPILLNLATLTGFCVINVVIGGQTLSAISNGNLSYNLGIVLVALCALFLSFAGYTVLHQYERYAWIPTLIAIFVALGCGGKYIHLQAPTEPVLASTVLSFGALVAGFILPYGAIASDFFTYLTPDAPPLRIFSYTFMGLFMPTVPLMVLGAAIGGAVPNVPSWSSAYDTNSAGGVLAAMLDSAGGFGKFCVVILAFSVLGNVAGTFYAITLNFQAIPIKFMAKVPRALFSIVITAIIIPVAIKAVTNFFVNLEAFIGVIGYWASAYIAIVLVEHILFRKTDSSSYNPEVFDNPTALPTGIAAISAGVLSFALVIPSMAQIWYTGPIAKTTGDIGFEVAFVLSGLFYVPLKMLEKSFSERKVLPSVLPPP